MAESQDKTPANANSPQNRRSFIKKAITLAGGITIAPISAIVKGQGLTQEETNKILSELVENTTSSGITLSASAGPCIENFIGDINQDCKVDTDDLNIMSSDWMSSDLSAVSNIDGSYTYIPGPGSAETRIYVDFHDFSLLSKDWGKQSSPL